MGYFHQYLKAGSSLRITRSQAPAVLVMSVHNLYLYRLCKGAHYYTDFFFCFPIALRLSITGINISTAFYWCGCSSLLNFSLKARVSGSNAQAT